MTDKFPRWAQLFVLGLFLLVRTAFAQTAQPPRKKPSPPAKPAPAATRPALEPKAIELLKASSDRLAAAHTLSFTAVELFEHLSRQGAPLAYATKYEVTLQRPEGWGRQAIVA